MNANSRPGGNFKQQTPNRHGQRYAFVLRDFVLHYEGMTLARMRNYFPYSAFAPAQEDPWSPEKMFAELELYNIPIVSLTLLVLEELKTRYHSGEPNAISTIDFAMKVHRDSPLAVEFFDRLLGSGFSSATESEINRKNVIFVNFKAKTACEQDMIE